MQEVDIKVHVAWWLKPYIVTLVMFAALHGTKVDQNKLAEKVRRGLKFSIQGRAQPTRS